MLQTPKRSVRFLPIGTVMTLGKNNYILKYIDSECYQFISGKEESGPDSNALAFTVDELQELYDRGVGFTVYEDDYFSLMSVVHDLAEWKVERVSDYEMVESIGSRALELLEKLNER